MCLGRTSTDRNIMTLQRRPVFYSYFIRVHISNPSHIGRTAFIVDPCIFRSGIFHVFLFGGQQCFHPGSDCTSCHFSLFVFCQLNGIGIQNIRDMRRRVPLQVHVVSNGCLGIVLSRFCCNQHYTISCTCTVDGGSRSIFQDRNVFYVARVHHVQIVCIHLYTVNDDQRTTVLDFPFFSITIQADGSTSTYVE